ncbi:MAG: RNA polymerase sigma factor [Candidatus Paceibacterota bacterium]
MLEKQRQQPDLKLGFETLFAEYSDVVYRFCLYKTSDTHVAYDLTQDTFMRLWKVICAGKDVEKPKQYIYQIARNLVIDYYKKEKALSLDNLQEKGFDPKYNGLETDFLAEVTILRQAIEKLEEDYREIIYMRFIEGMGIEDIAEAMNISTNLVSVRINRGKKKLQTKFT